VNELLSRALDSLVRALPCNLAAVLELGESELVARCARGPLAGACSGQRVALDDAPMLRKALEKCRPRVLRETDARGVQGLLHVPPGRDCMVVPLVLGKRAIGALLLDCQERESDVQEQADLATIYAQLIGLALTLAQRGGIPDGRQAASAQADRDPDPDPDADHWRTLNQVQSDYIRKVLECTGGKIYGPGGAAEILDIKPSTLQSRVQKLGVERIASKPRRPTV
jgi:transcriptional regulator with GAF, ATPase, and Fis domain